MNPGITLETTRKKGAALQGRMLALVLAGGAGSRMKGLTRVVPKPMLEFCGVFKVIDFCMSNIARSDITDTIVVTQYNQGELVKYLTQVGAVFNKWQKSLLICQSPGRSTSGGYVGTADAIYKNIAYIKQALPEFILILPADQIYCMDYREMLGRHIETGADITICSTSVPSKSAHLFGVMEVASDGTVRDFVEKPARISQGGESVAQISTGICIFNKNVLFGLLADDARDLNSTHDLSRNIIAPVVNRRNVKAFELPSDRKCRFGRKPYWRDVGSIEAYYRANFDVALRRALDVGAKSGLAFPFSYADVTVADTNFFPISGKKSCGSILFSDLVANDARVFDSIIFPRARVGRGALVVRSIVLPDAEIAAGARVFDAIVDRAVQVPKGFSINRVRASGRNDEIFVITRELVELVS